MKWIVLLFILFVPCVYAVNATISCPISVDFDDAFECVVGVSGGDSIYDLKVYIKGGGMGVNQIWDGNGWQRADWYLKGMIDGDGDYKTRLIIHKNFEGIAAGQLKLRDSGGKIVFDDIFEIEVGEKGVDGDKMTERDREKERDREEEGEGGKEEVRIKVKSLENKEDLRSTATPVKVINLNSQPKIKEGQLVYRSKNERIKDYVIYGFVFFLVCIIGVLLYEKRNTRNGYENHYDV